MTSDGWGIPMATDIAFALGVLALLGSRVPPGLKVFVAALAIVDDIFGVLVIALFYTQHISLIALGLAFVGVAVSFGDNWLGIRNPVIYALIGVGVWAAVLNSGVHATIAGILLAYPGLSIAVGGYTDNVGGDPMNQTLSENRANSVRDYLVQEGVATNSVSAKGFGNTLPVTSNDNAAGRQQNRRVELLVSGEAIGVPVNATTGSLR